MEKTAEKKLTLQAAKDEVAKHHGYNNWQQFLDYAYDEGLAQTVADYTDEAWAIHTELNELIEQCAALKEELERVKKGYNNSFERNVTLKEELAASERLRMSDAQSAIREANSLRGRIEQLTESNERLREALIKVRKLLYRKDEETGGWLCDPMYADFGTVLDTLNEALNPKTS